MSQNISDVDVAQRRLRASGRVNASGRLHEALLPTSTPKSWYQRIRERYFTREDIVVAGREIKGALVVHPILATAILGVMVTVITWILYSNSARDAEFRKEQQWQHDQLVVLATQKTDADRAAKQEHDDRALQESADKAWREKMKDQMNRLELLVQNTGKSRGQ